MTTHKQETEANWQIGVIKRQEDMALEQARTNARIDVLQEALHSNTAMTKDILELFTALRGGLKVLGGLGAVAKWFASIAAVVGIVWGAFHGKWP